MRIRLGTLALTVAAAVNAFAAADALALVTGHFTAEAPEHHLIIKGTDVAGTPHQVKLFEIKNEIGHPTATDILLEECTHVVYHGTLANSQATTNTGIQIRPTYGKCATPGDPPGQHNPQFHVPAACGTNVFEFTSGGTGTVHLNCTITVTRSNCEIAFTPQTTSGVTYATTTENAKHALTVSLSLKTLTAAYHAGTCVFLGTTHYFEMVGSLTMWGEDTSGSRVGITYT